MPSKRDADYLEWAKNTSGKDEKFVRGYGALIRARIKAVAKDAKPGVIRIEENKIARVRDSAPPREPAKETPAKADAHRTRPSTEPSLFGKSEEPPPIAGEAGNDRALIQADEDRAKHIRPAKALDVGKESIEDSPLFGGPRQGDLFASRGGNAASRERVQIALRPGKRGQDAFAVGNESAMKVLQYLVGFGKGEALTGLNVSHRGIQDAIEAAKSELAVGSHATQERQDIYKVLNVLKEAQDRGGQLGFAQLTTGVSPFAIRSTKREELFHAQQRKMLGYGKDAEHINNAWFFRDKLARKSGHNLRSLGYEDDADLLSSEIGAKLASGPEGWTDLGLSPAEAKTLAYRYAVAVIAKHGRGVVFRFRDVSPTIKKEFERAGRNASEQTIEKARSYKSPLVKARQKSPQIARQGPDGHNSQKEALASRRPDEQAITRADRSEPAEAAPGGAEGEGELRRTVGSDVPAGKPHERGSASLEFVTGGISRLFEETGPEGNYSGFGALQNKFVRNLSQLEKANPTAHTAALQAAGSRGASAVLLRAAVPKIEEVLKANNGPSWDEMRAALAESRLRGIRGRWIDLAENAKRAGEMGLKNEFEHGMMTLLDSIAGKGNVPENVAQTALALYNNAGIQDLRNKENADLFPEATAAEREQRQPAIDALRNFLSKTFMEAAGSVEHVLTMDDFDRITGNAGFQKALGVYKKLIEEPLAQNHAENEGVFSTALGPLQTYYPLIPFGKEESAPAGRRLAYRKPRNIANEFATGISPMGFDTGMTPLAERLNRAIRGNNKATLLTALQEQGLIRPIRPGDKSQTILLDDHSPADSQLQPSTSPNPQASKALFLGSSSSPYCLVSRG